MQSLQDLVGLEDYQLEQEHRRVILKPVKPWPTPDTLPRGTSCDRDTGLLWLDKETLVRCRDFFRSLQYQAAIFASCPSLKPPGSFGEAVSDVAGNTLTVVVVHNSDPMDVLLRVFQKATVLYLLHDLCLHEERATFVDGTHPLRELRGSCAALGTAQLVMTQGRVLQMGVFCPKIAVLNASLPDITKAEENPYVWTGFIHELKALVLGHHYRGDQGSSESYSEPSFSCMKMVKLVCPYLEHVTVNTRVPEVVTMVTDLELKSLSVTFLSGMHSFGACIPGLTLSRHSLQALSLCHFEGVDLAFIGTMFADLRRLSLSHCAMSDSEVRVGSFDKLQELYVEDLLQLSLQLLLHRCANLTSLSLGDPETSVTFLHPSFPKSQLQKLKVLRLRLVAPLKQCGLHTDDLDQLMKELPSLHHVATDNLDVRLYVENRARHVTLGWYDCTTCAARFPQQSKRHQSIWERVHSRPQ